MLTLAPAPRPAAAGRRRVLAVSRAGSVGEVERGVLAAAAAVQGHGWSTVLACPPGPLAEEARVQGLKVCETPISSLSFAELRRSPAAAGCTLLQMPRARADLLTLARWSGASLIHAHHPAGVLQAQAAAKRLGLPLVWHVHEMAGVSPGYLLLAGLAVAACDAFICVSQGARGLVERLGAPRERVRLVYDAVRPRLAAAPAGGLRLRGGPHIGVVGGLDPRAGHADAVRACAALTRRWPELRLWIEGAEDSPRSAAYGGRLQQQAESLGVSVTFTGAASDLELMRQMDVVVSAAVDANGPPRALLEAAALGRPVLATEVGCAGEIVWDGETGRLVPPAAPERLAAALGEILDGQGPALGERARLAAQARFSPGGFARALAETYAQLAAPPRAAPNTPRE